MILDIINNDENTARKPNSKRYTFSIRTADQKELYQIKLRKNESFAEIYSIHLNRMIKSNHNYSKKFIFTSNSEIIMDYSTPSDIKARSKKTNIIEIMELNSNESIVKVQEIAWSENGPFFENEYNTTFKIIKIQNDELNNKIISEVKLAPNNNSYASHVVELDSDEKMRRIGPASLKRASDNEQKHKENASLKKPRKSAKLVETEVQFEIKTEIDPDRASFPTPAKSKSPSDSENLTANPSSQESSLETDIGDLPFNKRYVPSTSSPNSNKQLKLEENKQQQEQDESQNAQLKEKAIVKAKDKYNKSMKKKIKKPTIYKSSPNSTPTDIFYNPIQKPKASITEKVINNNEKSSASPQSITTNISLQSQEHYSSLNRNSPSNQNHTPQTSIESGSQASINTQNIIDHKTNGENASNNEKQNDITTRSQNEIEQAKRVLRVISHSKNGAEFILEVVLNDGTQSALPLNLIKRYNPNAILSYSVIKNIADLLI